MKWMLRALRSEFIEFWSEYPLQVVKTAGPKHSLHYYVYSDSFSWDAMELDDEGVPQYIGRIFGRTYNPAYIAWYGLVRLQDYLRGTNPQGKDIFLKQVYWLKNNHRVCADGMIVWPFVFDWREGPSVAKAPWPSAIAQGQAISALVRAFRITGEIELLDLCKGATKAFTKTIDEGGIRNLDENHIIYAEYPCHPSPRILDGFLSSLLGLYDLHVQINDPEIFVLITDGIKGLKHFLPYWTYRNKWTWYGSRTYLCSNQYHTLNRQLLSSLARISNDSFLKSYAEQWDSKKFSPFSWLAVYLAFLVTKNLYRIQCQTWREKTALLQ